MAPAIFKVVQFENAAAFKIACLDSAAVRSEERARLYNSLISFRTSSRDLISGFQHMRSQSSFLFLLVFVDFTFGVRVCSRLPEVLDRLLVQAADPQSVPQFIPQILQFVLWDGSGFPVDHLHSPSRQRSLSRKQTAKRID